MTWIKFTVCNFMLKNFRFNENYGANGMMDWFHGTSKRFLASPQYQRHKMYFTLTPIREIFPDESKKVKEN